MPSRLEHLLQQILDGVIKASDIDQVRELVRHDARIPEELRNELFQDDLRGDAEALLAMFGGGGEFAAMLGEALDKESGTVEDVVLDDHWMEISTVLREGLQLEEGSIDVVEEVLTQTIGEHADGDTVRIADLVQQAVQDEAGAIDISGEVLAIVGDNDLTALTKGAVGYFSGTVDIANNVMTTLGIEEEHAFAQGLAAAIQSEAGTIDIAQKVESEVVPVWVSGILDNELKGDERAEALRQLSSNEEAAAELRGLANISRVIQSAVTKEAGSTPYCWSAVAKGIGIEEPERVAGYDPQAITHAIRENAGEIDIVDAVLDVLLKEKEEVERLVVEEIPEAAPSGRAFGMGLFALAAMALLSFSVFQTNMPAGELVEVSADGLVFASIEEVVVEDLRYAEDAEVFQAQGDSGALILWIDEEVML